MAMKLVSSYLRPILRDSPPRAPMDSEFTGPFPRYSGAISAVTNGSPEDINAMPAPTKPWVEGSFYDGFDLGT
jgi:hypothetical protein